MILRRVKYLIRVIINEVAIYRTHTRHNTTNYHRDNQQAISCHTLRPLVPVELFVMNEEASASTASTYNSQRWTETPSSDKVITVLPHTSSSKSGSYVLKTQKSKCRAHKDFLFLSPRILYL